ncbi:MAG: hypothetical protein WCT04_12865 [Planctomycetota bacterium]
MSEPVATFKWKFFRAGGFDQVLLDSGSALANLSSLDPKLWAALACPTTNLEYDAKTLALIDTDKDGRIRVPEILAAAKWACANLKNPDVLLKGSPTLTLSDINDTTDEGKQLLASAKRILSNLSKESATSINTDDTADTVKIFAQTRFNGDGIVPADATDDAALKLVIENIIASLGAETDRSGKPGVSQAKIDQFFADATAFSEWWKKAETDTAIMPLGDATAAASAAVKAVKTKLDDYIARCRLAAFDARAIGALNREEKEYLVITAKDLTLANAEIAALPLSAIAANKALSLIEGVNPAWAGAIATFHTAAVVPLLGAKTDLTEADWAAIQSKLAAYEAWSAAKAGASVEALGLARVREILTGSSKEALTTLVALDKALEPEVAAIVSVEKLIRYHRDFYKLLNNFVSFSDFYGRNDKAIFQVGTLFLDQRSCDLCLAVEDAGRHASMAGLAGAYLAYCDCVRKATGEKRTIVAAFTDGDSDNLMAGRNGVFYDRKGQDWDATITKIIDNPISVRQAFWAPYKKLARMIEEQVNKRAAAEADASDKVLAGTATATANVDKTKPVESKKLDIGVIAAMGVAFGAIGGALSALATGLMQLPIWQIPLVFVGLILLISGPSMALAWLKLRKRNLGPILDANGWAVNAKASINVPFGASLTKVATLPKGAQRNLTDPFAEKKSKWPMVIVFGILLWIAYTCLDGMGYIHEWSGGRVGNVRKAEAVPAATKPTVTPATTPAATPADAK